MKQVGKQRLVLDLSCRKRDGKYYVVTDRWQRFSELVVDAETLSSLGMAPLLVPNLTVCVLPEERVLAIICLNSSYSHVRSPDKRPVALRCPGK